ncbi:MAG: hypothetical protein WCZ23_01080 [Rhodospirillaceae bacterium]
MKTRLKTLDDVLAQSGITDASEFLSRFDVDAPVQRINSPHVQMRGSVQLMLNRTISRDEVSRRMAALRDV